MPEVEYRFFNFKTQTHDTLTSLPETDEQAMQYIPQQPAAQNMYMICRNMDKSIADSVLYVLDAVIRKNDADARA